MANTARVTQAALELLTSQTGDVRVTQAVLEYLVTVGVSCNNPPAGTVGIAYVHTFTAGGGDPPYTFTISSGALPGGLILNGATGGLSGIPTIAGTYTFGLEVTDSLGATDIVSCSIVISGGAGPVTVNPPLPITGGIPFGYQGCRRRNEFDWCMFLEMLKYRDIKFPPSCSIPADFLTWLPWDEDFGNNAVPEGAVPMRAVGGIVTPSAAVGDQVVISTRVPQGYDGLLAGIFQFYTGTGFEQGSGDIVWRVQLNQRYLENLGNVPFAMGSPQSPVPLTEGQVLLSGQILRYIVNVPDLSGLIQVGQSQITCGLVGFFWPR